MKVEDLRKGNFLLHKEDIVWVVEILLDDKISIVKTNGSIATVDINNLAPILIEDIWLISFGFIDPANNQMGYRIDVNLSDELCWYRIGGDLRYQTKGPGFTRDFGTKYIHELQNLFFALKKEDLKFDIKKFKPVVYSEQQ